MYRPHWAAGCQLPWLRDAGLRAQAGALPAAGPSIRSINPEVHPRLAVRWSTGLDVQP